MNLRNGWIDKHLYFIFQIQGFYFVQCPLYSVQCIVGTLQSRILENLKNEIKMFINISNHFSDSFIFLIFTNQIDFSPKPAS